jgi:hypothetical protein
MFVVFAVVQLFLRAGKPMWGVPALFVAVIVAAGWLGELVARFYSELLNRLIRQPWRVGKTTPRTGVDAKSGGRGEMETG